MSNIKKCIHHDGFHGHSTCDMDKTSAKNQTGGYLSELQAAMSDGWQIVQPIFARPLWSSLDDHQIAFHFVLQRERSTKLLTVPESRVVTRFIRQQSLMIDKQAVKGA
jgi:hypothetical protein